jgi:hypothetical protein
MLGWRWLPLKGLGLLHAPKVQALQGGRLQWFFSLAPAARFPHGPAGRDSWFFLFFVPLTIQLALRTQ